MSKVKGIFFGYKLGNLITRFSHESSCDFIRIHMVMSDYIVTNTDCDEQYQLNDNFSFEHLNERGLELSKKLIDLICNDEIEIIYCRPYADPLKGYTDNIKVQGEQQVQKNKQQLSVSPDQDPVIMKLTKAISEDDVIHNKDYYRVCNNKALYFILYKENKLFKLMEHAIKEGVLSNYSDGMKGLKEYFVNNWICPKGWRFLCKHGDTLFTYLWSKQKTGSRFISARNFLVTLDRANYPAIPSINIQEAWFQIYGNSFTNDFTDYESWSDVPSMVLKTVFNYVDQFDVQNDKLIDEMLKIFLWASKIKLVMDKNQTKSGWLWLIKQADKWYRENERALKTNYKKWDGYLENGVIDIEGFRLSEICDEQHLFNVSVKMRNCLKRYTYECIDNKNRFFTVIEIVKNQKRPSAVIGFRYFPEQSHWRVFEVKGFANQSVNKNIKKLIKPLSIQYNNQYIKYPMGIKFG
jgi:hypothetical protein